MKGYNELKREMSKIWDIPVKVGALETAPNKLKQ